MEKDIKTQLTLEEESPDSVERVATYVSDKLKQKYGKMWKAEYREVKNIQEQWENVIGSMTKEHIEIAWSQIMNEEFKEFNRFPPWPGEFKMIPLRHVEAVLPSPFEAYNDALNKDYKFQIVFNAAKKSRLDFIGGHFRKGFPIFEQVYKRTIIDQF
ncbi:MAG TPA: hypothetical protein VKR58_10995, partial [Aquella sp.]|nr:hypothetical protein [Aquella sp.]